jgi:hypothetical protein
MKILAVLLEKVRFCEYTIISAADYFMRGITDMIGYERAKDLAERWNISVRQVQISLQDREN